MTLNRWLMLVAACAPGAAARADTFEIVPGPPGPMAMAPPPGVGLGAVESPIFTRLRSEMAGQPVVVVDCEWAIALGGGTPAREGQTLLSRLQDICEAHSPANDPRAPFAVRAAWSLAPATRQEVNLDFSGLTALDVAGSGPLLTQVLGRLNAMQARALASPQGLDVGTLPLPLQAMVLRALRPPFEVARWKVERTPDGMHTRTGSEVLATVTQPVQARGLRLRAQLRSIGPELTRESRSGGNRSISRAYFGVEWPVPSRPEMRVAPFGGPMNEHARFEILQEVPNTFKPSDLDGAKVRPPIGIEGVHTVEDALKQIAKVSGLKLVASGQYRDRSVFIGSAALPAGDVLDAIRLGFTAAWRKVGDTYVLAWDRRGLGVLQAMSVERAASLREAVGRETQEARDSDIWLTLAMQTPFAEDDPIGWTDAQRKAIFSPRPEQFQGWEWPPMVMFGAMTPAQQQAIRAGVAGRTLNVPDAATGDYAQRAMTESDLARVTLPTQARLELVVSLPGIGWCATGDWWQESLDTHRVQNIRDRQHRQAEETKRKAEEAARLASSGSEAPPNRVEPAVRRSDPHVLPPAKRRGVMVPALPAVEVERVARLMAARGFDTLFYPVLTEGYVTMLSKAFPPHPSAGAKAWAAAVKAAKANGLTLVGYVEALAWRRPGATGHWLERFPHYLDTDIVGRPFSESVAAMAKRSGSLSLDVLGDLVRPREPEVEKRLATLLAEYMAQPGSSGLLLDTWSAGTALRSRNPYEAAQAANAVRLGYSVPDRLASLKKEGLDPVDMAWTNSEFRPRGPASPPIAPPSPTAGYQPFSGPWIGGDPRAGQEQAQYLALAAKVLPRARPDGAPWTTYAVASMAPGHNPTAMPVAPAASTVLLTGAPQNFGPNSGKPVSLVLRVPRREAPGESRPHFFNSGSGWPAIALSEGQSYFNPMGTPRDLVVYDFRGAPGEILDSLRRVGLPED